MEHGKLKKRINLKQIKKLVVYLRLSDAFIVIFDVFTVYLSFLLKRKLATGPSRTSLNCMLRTAISDHWLKLKGQVATATGSETKKK